jgi:hypothetical protein
MYSKTLLFIPNMLKKTILNLKISNLQYRDASTIPSLRLLLKK